MSLRLGNERVQAMAAFQSRHRAEMLSVVLIEVVGMTRLRQERGDAEALRVKQEHDALVREMLRELPESIEVAVQGDRFFLAFSKPSVAVTFAVRLQGRLREWNQQRRFPVSDRMGVHVGEVLLETSLESGSIHGLNGLEVDRCERVLNLAEPGRILLTRPAFDMARTALQGIRVADGQELRWIQHGPYGLAGLAEPMEICEVAGRRDGNPHPPPDSLTARRVPPMEFSSATVGRMHLLVGAVLTTLIGAVLLAVEDGPLTVLSYDLAYLLRRPEYRTEAVMIQMDPPSYEHFGQNASGLWDRGLHATLIEWLTPQSPRAIVLDTLLHHAPPEHSPAEAAASRRLVEAAKTNGRVVVAADVTTRESEIDGSSGTTVRPPFQPLRDVVRLGTVALPENQAPFARRMLCREIAGTRPLPVEVMQVLSRTNLNSCSAAPWLNFYGPPGTGVIRSFSYADVLEGKVSPREFRDKIVLVGANYTNRKLAGGLSRERSDSDDNWYTPYRLRRDARSLSPGVEVVATACLNLLRGDGLRRLSGLTELAILAVTGLGAVCLVARTRPLVGLGFAGAAAALIAYLGMASVWWTHVWFPWLIVSAVQLPGAVAWCTLARLDRRPRVPSVRTQPGGRDEPARPSSQAPKGPASDKPSAALPGTRTDALTAPTAAMSSPLASSSPTRGSGLPEDSMMIPIPVIPDYHVLRLIGKGGYGEVWLCRSTSGIHRAVKVVRRANFTKDKPYDDEFDGIRRYEPVSLSHTSLLAILHVGRRDAEGYFFYVMELGDDLRNPGTIDPASYEPRNLAKDLKRLGRLTVAGSLRLGEDLASALDVLHREGLLHRDVKPANIIFLKGVPKLADIGLVTLADRGDDSISLVGTIGYIPPEGPRSPASDIFSLGKVLYEASTGIPASEYPDLPATLPEREDCAEFLKLNELVLRACDMDPRKRFASAAEFREAMRALRLQLAETP